MHTPRAIYATYLEPFARRVGVHDALATVYWRLRAARTRGTVTHEVAGTTARFRVATTEEYRRFRSLREERAVIADVLDSLRHDDVVFDVGANVGTYTCFLARRLPGDRVVAFEPHPANLAALRANLARNDADATVVEVALSDGTGTGELAVHSHDAGAGEHALATDGRSGDDSDGAAAGNGVGGGDGVGGGNEQPETSGTSSTDASRGAGPDARSETIEVGLATGDDLVAAGTVPPPTVLKVDVEGAELRVLEGLADALEAGPVRLAYVEVHPDHLARYGDDAHSVRRALESRGFAVDRIADRGTEYFLRAEDA